MIYIQKLQTSTKKLIHHFFMVEALGTRFLFFTKKYGAKEGIIILLIDNEYHYHIFFRSIFSILLGIYNLEGTDNMKAIQFTFATICLTVTFLAATGCNNNQAPATPASSSTTEVVNTTTKSSFERVIKHVAGETILKEAPRNIAILDYSYIDYLTALEMKPGSTVSFVDNELPPYLSEQVQADEITFLGPIGGVNPEKVLAADPDLIIGTSPVRKKYMINYPKFLILFYYPNPLSTGGTR